MKIQEGEYTLRIASLNDVEFLVDLRMETMEDHLRKAGITLSLAEHRERVLHNFPFAKIIMYQGENIGMIKWVKNPTNYEIEQFQIAQKYQGKGIGVNIIKECLKESELERLPIKLSVLKNNKAQFLYERLGFERCGEDSTSYFMIKENGDNM